jgi:hypothetical protein
MIQDEDNKVKAKQVHQKPCGEPRCSRRISNPKIRISKTNNIKYTLQSELYTAMTFTKIGIIQTSYKCIKNVFWGNLLILISLMFLPYIHLEFKTVIKACFYYKAAEHDSYKEILGKVLTFITNSNMYFENGVFT